MAQAKPIDFAAMLPGAEFSETHSRSIERPIERVWNVFLGLPANEIRLLRPLFELRGLPARLVGKQPPAPVGDRPALELFAEEGFIILHEDESPTDGRATLVLGAAGKFWSPAHNKPRRFTSADEFFSFDEPGWAKTIARFEAWEVDGRTILQTETLVAGNDRASARKFAPYWAIIRGPSGLLRRSWLAAVERGAKNAKNPRTEGREVLAS